MPIIYVISTRFLAARRNIMKNLKRAIRDGYVKLNKRDDIVTYLPQGKTRKYSNPEELVQLETYLTLLYRYKYPVNHIRVCDKVKIGSSSREADVVVYNDSQAKDPLITVECKKRKVSKKVFDEAIEQGFSYAAATNSEYVWATSGDKNAYFEVWDNSIKERRKNRIGGIPRFSQTQKNSPLQKFSKWLGRKPILTDTLLYSIVLLVCMGVLTKLLITYYDDLRKVIDPFINQFGWELNWVYNTLVFAATLLSLVFGGVFMRSHQFFNTPRLQKRASYSFLALILFLPSWYMGISMPDANWWTESHFFQEPIKEWIFFLPYLKGMPFTFILVFLLITLLGRTS